MYAAVNRAPLRPGGAAAYLALWEAVLPRVLAFPGCRTVTVLLDEAHGWAASVVLYDTLEAATTLPADIAYWRTLADSGRRSSTWRGRLARSTPWSPGHLSPEPPLRSRRCVRPFGRGSARDPGTRRAAAYWLREAPDSHTTMRAVPGGVGAVAALVAGHVSAREYGRGNGGRGGSLDVCGVRAGGGVGPGRRGGRHPGALRRRVHRRGAIRRDVRAPSRLAPEGRVFVGSRKVWRRRTPTPRRRPGR